MPVVLWARVVRVRLEIELPLPLDAELHRRVPSPYSLTVETLLLGEVASSSEIFRVLVGEIGPADDLLRPDGDLSLLAPNYRVLPMY